MQALDLNPFPVTPIPRFFKARQIFPKDHLVDLESKISSEIEPYLQGLAHKKIAIGIGSRGIVHIKEIAQIVIQLLKKAQANPFIIPAMGSHGGSTPEGQSEVLASYGITEESMGVPIDDRLDVSPIGELEPGLPIYFAKSALEADGIIVIARIKPHTAFHGPIESGVAKMLTIGLGKQIGADSLHHQGFGRFAEIIPKAAQFVTMRCHVLFGLAVIENAYEEIYKVEVLSRDDILSMRKESLLLSESRKRMARILILEFDVLVIEEIGKNISGDGQDPNVTGLSLTPYAREGPTFQKSVIFDLSPDTHGNANGVGVVDIITQQLLQKIDFQKTYVNALTSTELLAGKIPLIAKTKEDALRIALKTTNRVNHPHHRVVWIKNTLELEEIFLSEALLSETGQNSMFQILSDPQEVQFRRGEPILPW